MILLLIISSVTLALIILVIFVFINIKTHKEFVVVDYIDNCKYPSVIVLNNNGLYTNIINSPKDKILITFISGEEIKGAYLNQNTFQLFDKQFITRIFKPDSISPFNLFSFNFNICINSPYRITSLISKTTYFLDFKFAGFFFNDLDFFAITSISPLIIHKINNNNFSFHSTPPLTLYWNNSYGSLHIKSNPILINGIYWFIATNNIKLVFILFDIINNLFINSFSININFDIHFGLIYNKFNDSFSIPIFKNNKIHFFNLLRNSLFSNS